jgi:hypothetical protein
MRMALRAVVSLAVFAGVGLWAARAVVAYSAGRGTPAAEINLTAAMAGLFAGGAAMVLALFLLLLFTGRRD